jgi:hypothetical protein
MIKNLGHVGTNHKCNVCACEFTDDEGGVLGYFGILPVAFCPTCYSSMVDMVQQDLELGFEDENLEIDINKNGINPEGEYSQ